MKFISLGRQARKTLVEKNNLRNEVWDDQARRHIHVRR
jgi:hypothetical protein